MEGTITRSSGCLHDGVNDKQLTTTCMTEHFRRIVLVSPLTFPVLKQIPMQLCSLPPAGMVT